MPCHIDALIERKKWFLRAIDSNGDSNLIENTCSTPDQIFMATRDRIESSRVNGFIHDCSGLDSIPKDNNSLCPLFLCAGYASAVSFSRDRRNAEFQDKSERLRPGVAA